MSMSIATNSAAAATNGILGELAFIQTELQKDNNQMILAGNKTLQAATTAQVNATLAKGEAQAAATQASGYGQIVGGAAQITGSGFSGFALVKGTSAVNTASSELDNANAWTDMLNEKPGNAAVGAADAGFEGAAVARQQLPTRLNEITGSEPTPGQRAMFHTPEGNDAEANATDQSNFRDQVKAARESAQNKLKEALDRQTNQSQLFSGLGSAANGIAQGSASNVAASQQMAQAQQEASQTLFGMVSQTMQNLLSNLSQGANQAVSLRDQVFNTMSSIGQACRV